MNLFLRQTLERQLIRLHELDALLSASDVVSDMERFRRLTREHAETSLLAEHYRRLTQREADLASAQALRADVSGDAEMAQMAEDEIAAAHIDIAELDQALQLMLIPKDPDDVRNSRRYRRRRVGSVCGRSAAHVHPLCRPLRLALRAHQ
jgi:peptide chain release factor 1